jgi:cytosine/adenosine deaminase-related metal-dependent hydrolase
MVTAPLPLSARDPAGSLVACGSGQVDTVILDGRLRMRTGQLADGRLGAAVVQTVQGRLVAAILG